MPLGPQMLVDTWPSTQRTSSMCERKAGICLLPLTQTYSRRYLAIQALHLFYVPRWCHLYYGLELVWVDFNAPLRHYETQEFSCCYSKCAFTQIELYVIRAEGIESLLEVIQMVVFPSTFHQHVVYVDLDVPPNLMCKHFVYQPLICRVYVLETERHHFVAEEALAGDE